MVAQRVAQAMEWRGLDQTDLADAIGVTQGAISKILVGKTANSRLLPKIAVELRVPLPWLLGKTDEAVVTAAELAITNEDREWLDILHRLSRRDLGAVLQLARTLAGVGEDRAPFSPSPAPQLQTQTLHSSRQDYRGQ